MAKRRDSKGRFKGGGGGGGGAGKRKSKGKKRLSGGRRRRRGAVPVRIVTVAASRRRRRRARANPVAAAPRRRRRRSSGRRRTQRHGHRHHRARSNPMSGGQFLFAVASAGLGFAAADFVDRYLATYDPAAYGTPSTQLALPTDRFTGGNGTLANSLNVAGPPSLMRIGAGVGMIALPTIGAMAIKHPMLKAGMQGAAIGAGVKLFSKLWDSYVIGKLLKPAAGANPLTGTVLGLRLYPAELTAQANMANSPQTLQSNALSPGLGRQAPGRLAGDVGPVAQGAPAQLARPPMNMRSSARGLGDDPTTVEDSENCGCLGDRLPMFLGVLGNAA